MKGEYTELRPSAIYKPRLFLDGDQWCALYGENLQEGIAGFGKTPSDALIDFNNAFLVEAPTPSDKPVEEMFPGTREALERL